MRRTTKSLPGELSPWFGGGFTDCATISFAAKLATHELKRECSQNGYHARSHSPFAPRDLDLSLYFQRI
jgi:hypothetical protein